MEEFLTYVLVPGFFIYVALKVLEAIFIFAIKTFKIIGAFVIALFPVALMAYISQQVFGLSPFELGIQTIGTEATLGLIAFNMFNKTDGGQGLDPNQ